MAPRRVDRWLAYAVGNRVGESPLWDARRGVLWWIDVRAPEVLCLDPRRDEIARWTLPEVVGAICLRSDGSLGVALARSVAVLDPEALELRRLVAVEHGRSANRLNDGKVSPRGSWWLVGSMDDTPGEKQTSGALYRIGRDRGVARLLDGLCVANGIAWNLAGTRLYWSDSYRGRIWCGDWDEATGTLTAIADFARSDEAQGRPDGAIVDAGDRYLSAGVSAGCLNRFDATGARIDSLRVPCRAPTMPCFGGDGDLFVTSLRRPEWTDAGELDGALWRLPESPYPAVPGTAWAV
jgi:sugar lactone lactonase YvrE